MRWFLGLPRDKTEKRCGERRVLSMKGVSASLTETMMSRLEI